ncbi:MAG: sigma-70 family RNA polymerase sigma factor [Lewinellaceae bacterium]|nr:sigma-70 family RNA polymerase sigma factor [Lewinellaceae bacterium]
MKSPVHGWKSKNPVQKVTAPISDETLIALALEGRESAYTLLVNRHRSLIKAMVQRYLPSGIDPDDVVQDVFIRAFRCLAQFRGDCKFSSWLVRVAISVAINRSKEPRRLQFNLEQLPLGDSLREEALIQRQLEKQEQNQKLHALVRKLGTQDSTIIDLYYFQELSVMEICQQTGLSESNIKSRLMRARRKLKSAAVLEGLR